MFKKTNETEDEDYGDDDLDDLGGKSVIDSKKLEDLAERLSKKLEKYPKDKPRKKAVNSLKTDFIPRMKKYEQYEQDFKGRNNFSKTDKDASFMQMKEDHMKNRTMKPGYNVQIGTENQMIEGFSIHLTSTDSPTLIEHVKQVKKNLATPPPILVADAGYGSEETIWRCKLNRLHPM